MADLDSAAKLGWPAYTKGTEFSIGTPRSKINPENLSGQRLFFGFISSLKKI
jgi:hypothetical protein